MSTVIETSGTAKSLADGNQSQVKYTSPTHPQVPQMGPVHRSICGMALESVRATLQADASSELTDMTKPS